MFCLCLIIVCVTGALKWKYCTALLTSILPSLKNNLEILEKTTIPKVETQLLDVTFQCMQTKFFFLKIQSVFVNEEENTLVNSIVFLIKPCNITMNEHRHMIKFQMVRT